ncbi:MAG: hypothetical protein AB1716_20710, partial [Planctomycetota bacterium]
MSRDYDRTTARERERQHDRARGGGGEEYGGRGGTERSRQAWAGESRDPAWRSAGSEFERAPRSRGAWRGEEDWRNPERWRGRS